MERDEFIKKVASDFITNNKSLYFGAGLSKNFSLPNWSGIFLQLKNNLSQQFQELNAVDTDDPDCYAVGEYISNIIKDRDIILDKITDILKMESSLNDTQKELYDYLIKQEYNSIWTTNFDSIFEDISNRNHYQANVVDLSSELNAYKLLKQKRTLYKINGSITDKNRKIILTKNDFESYNNINKSFITMLKRELICNTFLFIGCSFTDGILRPILHELKQVFQKDFRHYAIFIKSKDIKNQDLLIKDLEERYGICSYVIDAMPENITSEIVSLLRMIYRYSINRNVFISGSISNPKDNESHSSFIKKLVYNLYERQYKIIGGVGKKISYYIGSATTEYMANNYETDRSKFLDQEYFYLNNDEDVVRKRMINRARHSIFMYCHCFDNEAKMQKSGTYKEFLMSRENENTIIPLVNKKIGSGKYCLYNEVDSEMYRYMKTINDDNQLIRAIIDILDNRQSIIDSN